MMTLLSSLAVLTALGAGEPARAEVWFQAHRGGLLEVPENTLVAYEHAWACPGAIPEVDVQVTSDGIMVCIHDDTPERTTNAPAPFRNKKIGDIPFDTLRQWDAGSYFDPKYADQRIPTLEEVFAAMKGKPERQLYLDIKNVDLDALANLIQDHGVGKQVLFVHGRQEMCARLKERFPGARTMTWISGKPESAKARFRKMAQGGFRGIDQIQLHLQTESKDGAIRYVFDDAFLEEAVAAARAADAELQLRPFDFDAASLRRLIGLGVRLYVADEPRRFSDTIAEAMKESDS